jgi:hypothetical protein
MITPKPRTGASSVENEEIDATVASSTKAAELTRVTIILAFNEIHPLRLSTYQETLYSTKPL